MTEIGHFDPALSRSAPEPSKRRLWCRPRDPGERQRYHAEGIARPADERPGRHLGTA
jgi:hypothetical protein